MKRWFVWFFLFVAAPAYAEAPAADFEAATERALAGDEAAAIALYESLVSSGVKNEDLFFNLGNVYTRSGRHLDAIVAYERALRLAPGDAAARTNLSRVRAAFLQDDAAEAPAELGLADVLDPLVRVFPRRLMMYVLLALNLALVVLLVVRRRRLAMVLTVLTLLVGSVVLSQVIVANDARAVALESVDLRRGPNARYETRGAVRAGARVRIVGETAGWYEVQNLDGTTGWLLAKHVEPV